MTDLASFLLARIADDEARNTDLHDHECESVAEQPVSLEGIPKGPCDCEYPARVLAECEAKRRIVELHNHPDGSCWEMHRGTVAPDWKEEWDGRKPGEPWAHPSLEGPDVHPGPCETLQLLALPYADHPDFDPSWMPGGTE